MTTLLTKQIWMSILNVEQSIVKFLFKKWEKTPDPLAFDDLVNYWQRIAE